MRAVFVLLAALACAAASVTELNTDNFDNLVDSDSRVWVVEFGSKFCGSCQAFGPFFHDFAEKQPALKFGVSYVDGEEGMKLAGRFPEVLDIGLPAVVVFGHIDIAKYTVVAVLDPTNHSKFRNDLRAALSELTKRDGVYWKTGAVAHNTEF
eukprot:m.121474 g.121474  ORF g.121474 m.121474 type:complete len:152 (+) comp9299_c0_seq4:3830-4285(+)